ncbi:MAG TPA: hypothetical protein VGX48_22245 [Pyrinomonadaceae bacterium]|jgi:hypothetical protein|nr:hypothetical protein [Pyrinomonadaceae bacterium]
MSPVILFAAATLAAAYLYIYLYTVVRARRKHGQKMYLPFDSVAPESLPPDVRRKFAETLPGLEAAGFVVVDYVHHAGMPQEDEGRLDLYSVILRNDESGDMASVTEIFSQFRQSSMSFGYVAFHAEFDGGAAVTTLNISQVPVFSADPRRPVFRFPGVGDTRFLYRAHRALLARGGHARRGVLPSPGMEAVHICESEAKSFRHQIERGYFRYDEAQGMCIPTWKGAALMTATQMWGVRGALMLRMRARANSTLKSLGLRP